jgi:hypothetical protein
MHCAEDWVRETYHSISHLTPARASVGLVEDLRAVACDQVRHNTLATWHRVPATSLPCCTGVADLHDMNGVQCSHEDENTRIVCIKAGDIACGAAVSPNRCCRSGSRSQGRCNNGLQLHGSHHDSARLEAR